MIKPGQIISTAVLGICLVWMISQTVNAQSYTLTSTSGVFTPLTVSTTISEIGSADNISNPIPIGFTFNYYGTAYTQLKVSTDGFITFNPVGFGDHSNNISGGPSFLPIFQAIAPLWDDLSGFLGTASYNLSGTAPNRVLTIEWLNWNWESSTPTISFQVKLYETSNSIEFIYRQESGSVASFSNGASIGLIGNVRGQFYSLSNSSATPELDPVGVDNILTKPANGQHYMFDVSPAAVVPTSQATAVTFSNVTGLSATLSWANGNGTYRYVFVKRTTSTSETVALTDGTFYPSSTVLESISGIDDSGWFCVYSGAGTTVSITNLQPGYTYRAQVVEYNGLGGTQKYLTTAAVNNPANVVTVLSAPTTPTSTLLVGALTATAIDLYQVDGNGTSVAIFMRAGNDGTAAPANNTTYTGNSVFGSGIQIGNTGWYCVFSGERDALTYSSDLHIKVSGLAPNTEYRVQVIDYNGPAGNEQYNSVTNPIQFTTLPALPAPVYTFAASTGTFTPLVGGSALHVIEGADVRGDGIISDPVPIGFTFRFDGMPVTQVRASSNGFLTFNLVSDVELRFINTLTFTTYRPLVAPLWGDISGQVFGRASYQTSGTAPNRVFTFEWLGWVVSTSPGISMQVKLYEADNHIEYTYRQESGMLGSVTFSTGLALRDGFLSLDNTTSNPTTSTIEENRDLNIKPASNQVYSFTPSKITQSIAFDPLAPKLPTDVSFTLSATSTSGLPVTYTSSNPGVATISGNTVTIVGVGSTDITASQTGDKDFASANTVVRTLLVGQTQPQPIVQTITFDPLADKNFGDANFELTGTSSSGLPISYSSANTDVATVSGTTITIVGTGTTDITASQAGDNTYSPATTVIRTLTVNKAKQTITFGNLTTMNFGDANFELTGTSNSSLPVVYSSANTAVATVSGTTVTIVGGGTTDITASQPGDNTYSAATPVARTLTVNKANQTITFNSLTAKTLGDPVFALTATSTSGLPVSYSATNNNITINGNQVTIAKAGLVTINADQAGNSNYKKAAEIGQTFCINPVKPSLTVDGIDTGSVVLTSSSSAGNQWFNNAVAIDGATNATYTVNAPGTYTVVVSAGNCSSVPSDGKSFVVTEIENSNSSVKVFPNPVQNRLTVEVTTQSVLLSLYDITGRVLHTAVIQEQSTIDVSAYPAGIYLLKIQDGENTIVKKIVKN